MEAFHIMTFICPCEMYSIGYFDFHCTECGQSQDCYMKAFYT